MTLTDLPPLLRDDPAILQLLGRKEAVIAAPEAAWSMVVAALSTITSRSPVVVAVRTSLDAERLHRELCTTLGERVVELFPAWETLPFERMSPTIETMGRRARVLWRLRSPALSPAVIVAPIRALIQRVEPDHREITPIFLAPGREIDQHTLIAQLVAMGYRREYQVEHRGELAVRGSIVDIFPSTDGVPVRLDFWGDEIERLTEFSSADQRSTTDLERVAIFPAREFIPNERMRRRADRLISLEPWGREHWERIATGELFDGLESWLPWLADEEVVLFDLIGPDSLVILAEPSRLRNRAADMLAEEADLAATLARTWGVAVDSPPVSRHSADEPDDRDDTVGPAKADEPATSVFPQLHLPFDRLLAHATVPTWSITGTPESPDVVSFSGRNLDSGPTDIPAITRQLGELLGDGHRIVVAVERPATAQRMADLLREHHLDFRVDLDDSADVTQAGGWIRVAELERGFVLSDTRLTVVAESDLTGRRRSRRRPRQREGDAQRLFDDLQPGDFVVHHVHGVGRYEGLVQQSLGGPERDYLEIAYKGDDRLFVPTDQIDAIRPYTGGDAPKLHRMGGSDFARAKTRVRSEVAEIAQELVVLYQRRLTTPGRAFGVDTPWQREMEDAFGHRLTPDQAQAVEDVKADMERSSPMDRLVCGDVGFGKTEVAMRAAFKAIQDGKQVAVLVPTTLLAQQHGQTFGDRFAPFPIRVETLSRFLTPAQAREVAAGVAIGSVDLVIGTHRLLSEDISFHDLGLLIVDEEQRFGVKHKERIKSFREGVDVLTLTATPIPRTLEMSLTGIRDLSVINTPPAERQPILTYVGEYDERPVAEAIRRELLREGQVFFVHNRVMDIERVTEDLRRLVPEARVAVAHGQMDESSLEQIVIDFWEGEYDVLVCTTIIESGIDMPTVNTLVVDRADLLGLGQLHQLRGRVGRAGQRAYAYLFTPPGRSLSEQAYERLKTIGETTALGSGFKIAMRDLEIRGAGNLLGTGQTGHIAAVGYDLYCQLVTEAVSELKGEPPVIEAPEIRLDLPIEARLPADYVEREDLRIEAYRRLTIVATESEVDDIASEWKDRYGALPPEAEGLLRVARLRAECVRTGVTDISVVKGPGFGGPVWVARLSPVSLPTSKAIRLERLFPKARLTGSGLLEVPLGKQLDPPEALVALLRTLIPPIEET